MSKPVSPVLLGLSGPTLSADETAFIKALNPMGFLLFARNIQTPEQTRALCKKLQSFSPFESPFIAVDQEGGRVQRLQFGGNLPPAKAYGDWYQSNPGQALEACRLGHLLLAAQLRDVGATWVLSPVLDVAHPNTHAIIGDRAFSDNPATVAALGQAALEGLRAGGCFACLKHAPGHGRATTDSHAELPIVTATRAQLAEDSLPFQKLAPQADFIMTAHIRYPAFDSQNAATNSPALLNSMRQRWNFNGLILADDLGMKALRGTYAQRAQNALKAGCDIVICSFSKLKAGMAGTIYNAQDANQLADAVLPSLNPVAHSYLQNMAPLLAPSPQTVAEAQARFNDLVKSQPLTN